MHVVLIAQPLSPSPCSTLCVALPESSATAADGGLVPELGVLDSLDYSHGANAARPCDTARRTGPEAKDTGFRHDTAVVENASF